VQCASLIAPYVFRQFDGAALSGVSGVRHITPSTASSCSPAGVIGLLVPACGGVVKQPLNALVAKLLASLQEGTGGDKGSLTGQQDIELIDQLIDYFVDLAQETAISLFFSPLSLVKISVWKSFESSMCQARETPQVNSSRLEAVGR
jgi:hypothetical protein